MNCSNDHISGMWTNPVSIGESFFVNKSLCVFSVNMAMGCAHGCIFCYVTETLKYQEKKLRKLGVCEPGRDWGKYVFLRPFDEDHFRKSLKAAMLKIPIIEEASK